MQENAVLETGINQIGAGEHPANSSLEPPPAGRIRYSNDYAAAEAPVS